MKYSDFLKANGITHEQLGNLLQTGCRTQTEKDILSMLWGRAIAKTNPPALVVPTIEKALADPIVNQKTGFLDNYGAYEIASQKKTEKDYQDEDAMFLATLDSWRNWEEHRTDYPNMEESYRMEAEY